MRWMNELIEYLDTHLRDENMDPAALAPALHAMRKMVLEEPNSFRDMYVTLNPDPADGLVVLTIGVKLAAKAVALDELESIKKDKYGGQCPRCGEVIWGHSIAMLDEAFSKHECSE